MNTPENNIAHTEYADSILDQLRSTWNEVETPPPFEPAKSKPRRAFSHRDKLKRFYNVLLTVCLIMAVFGGLNMKSVDMPVAIAVAFSAFFCLMAILIYLQRAQVEKLDFGMSTSTELLARIDRLERLRTTHLIVGCATCVPLLAAMLHHYAATDPWFVAGGCCGALAGFTIGLINRMRMGRLIRAMRDELAD